MEERVRLIPRWMILIAVMVLSAGLAGVVLIPLFLVEPSDLFGWITTLGVTCVAVYGVSSARTILRHVLERRTKVIVSTSIDLLNVIAVPAFALTAIRLGGTRGWICLLGTGVLWNSVVSQVIQQFTERSADGELPEFVMPILLVLVVAAAGPYLAGFHLYAASRPTFFQALTGQMMTVASDTLERDVPESLTGIPISQIPDPEIRTAVRRLDTKRYSPVTTGSPGLFVFVILSILLPAEKLRPSSRFKLALWLVRLAIVMLFYATYTASQTLLDLYIVVKMKELLAPYGGSLDLTLPPWWILGSAIPAVVGLLLLVFAYRRPKAD